MPNSNPIRNFNPDAGAPVPLAEAAAWTANYRNEPPTMAEAAGRPRINAYYFGNRLLEEIQRQEGCVGLRFYMGVKKGKGARGRRDEPQLLVVGVDKDGRDILPRRGVNGETLYDDGIVGDEAMKCPTHCDPHSPLS